MENKADYISCIREKYEHQLKLFKEIRLIVTYVTNELKNFEGKIVTKRIETHLAKTLQDYYFYYKIREHASCYTLSIEPKENNYTSNGCRRIKIELNLETEGVENRFSMQLFQEKNHSYFFGLDKGIKTYERLLSDKDNHVACLADSIAKLMPVLKEVAVQIYDMPDTSFLMEKLGLKDVNLISLKYAS